MTAAGLNAAAWLLVALAVVGAVALAADICLAGRTARRPARHPRMFSARCPGRGGAAEGPDAVAWAGADRGQVEAPGGWCSPATRLGPSLDRRALTRA